MEMSDDLHDVAGVAYMLAGSVASSLHSDLAGVPVSVASPEDTVSSKLEWAHLGGSERQIEDAATVLRQQGERLDHGYLDRCSAALGVIAELARARRLAGTGRDDEDRASPGPPDR
jgi:hypothetical protein